MKDCNRACCVAEREREAKRRRSIRWIALTTAPLCGDRQRVFESELELQDYLEGAVLVLENWIIIKAVPTVTTGQYDNTVYRLGSRVSLPRFRLVLVK